MGHDDIGNGSSGQRRQPASARFVGKGRYTNAPPQTATTAQTATRRHVDEIEVQVGDVTLVVSQEEDARMDKYSARSAPAYGAIDSVVEDETAEEEPAAPVLDLLVDDPIPAWTEWRSEVVSSSAGYHRRETRLVR